MEYINHTDFIELFDKGAIPKDLLKTFESFDGIVDRIKIKTDNWGSSAALNVRIAQYMQAVQKDIITAWNTATGQNVTLTQLNDHPFLIVEFEVQNGCLKIKQAIKLADIIVKDLSPRQKMALYTMLFVSVLAVCTSFTVWKLADSGSFDSDEVRKFKILAQQKESAKVIINNLGGGTVHYQGKDWTAADLRSDRKKIESVSATENVALDGTYIIDTCKLEGGIHIQGENGRQFNADVDFLDEEKRRTLSSRLGTALIQKKKLEQLFRIDAQIKDGAIIKAHIIDIDQPARPHTISLDMARTNTDIPAMKQGSLLETEYP